MNTTTQPARSCPKCGAPVPPEAPQGLCPKCVLGGAAAIVPDSAPPAGEVPTLERVAAAFPQLELLEFIGRGGMGFVYKARQPHLDRLVALKLLPETLAQDPQFAERFGREGRVLAKLNHPNIVSVFDFGRTETFYYLIMEYVDGLNLRQAMQTGRFSPGEVLSIVPSICAALQYAHEQGVLHRDIKPENILLDSRGRVKIADFGIAKLMGGEGGAVTLTNTGSALGTPHYMAPEQLEQPATVDQRADIYSLGVVFYEMLTGELPLGRFGPPSTKTPVSAGVDEAVLRALERDRERRQRTALELGRQVETATNQPAAEHSSVEPTASKISRKAIWAASLVGLSLAIVGMPLFLTLLTRQSLGLGVFEFILLGGPGLLGGLAGTVLGWVALTELRTHRGMLTGLPLAVFSALAWPLLLLMAVTIGLPAFVSFPVTERSWMTWLGHALVWILPAGVITFALWTVHATVCWAQGRTFGRRRGVLKWVFLGVLAIGIGVLLLQPGQKPPPRPAPVLESSPAIPIPTAPSPER